MSKLADEIRAKKITEHIDYDTSRNQTLIECASLVEKREYERGVALIELINDSDSKDPFFVGWNCAIKKVLDMEAKQ